MASIKHARAESKGDRPAFVQSRMRIAIFLIPALISLFLTGRMPGSTSAAGFQVPHEGSYMVKALRSYTDAYWARVAGRDTGLPPRTNGHDEFAAQWSRDMLSALRGLHAGVVRQSFPTPGFRNLPARRPGMNVIVTVPGSRNPEQSVVVGTHYDGEPFSRGSTYDDASGCMIELGVARGMGTWWRAHGPPAISVQFIIFDGEEQGLVGSQYYLDVVSHGALMPKPLVMINEEQSGVGYPVRPFGMASQSPLPMTASTSERLPSSFGKPKPVPTVDARRLDARLASAVTRAFSRLHAVYSPLSFAGEKRDVFADADRRLVLVGSSGECCSDNDPFQLHGIANVTFSGDFDFYSAGAPPWSYPFDQPWDTFRSLACDTSGAPVASAALEAALDLPLTISALLLERYAPSTPGNGVAAFSAPAWAGHATQFTAVGATNARWEYGDGTSADGLSSTHVYKHPGTYRVRVTAGGISTTWALRVGAVRLRFSAPMGAINPPPIRTWQPTQLRGVAGCSSLSGSR